MYETEAGAARDAALADLTPENLERITPQQAIRLQELGVDIGALKNFQPKKEPLANLLQNMDNLTEESADVLAPQYGLEPEKLRAMLKEARTRKEAETNAKFEQEKALRLLGLTPQKKSDYDIYLELGPEKYKEYKAAGGSGKGGGDPYTKKLQEEQAKADVSALQGLPALDTISTMILDLETKDLADEAAKKPEPFFSGGRLKSLSAAGQAVGFTGQNDLATLPDEANLLAQKANSMALQAAEIFKGQGQVTEGERKILAETKILPTDTRAQRIVKYKDIKGAVESGMRKMRDAGRRAGQAAPEMFPEQAPAEQGWSVRVAQ
jgi:hypothetical protein